MISRGTWAHGLSAKQLRLARIAVFFAGLGLGGCGHDHGPGDQDGDSDGDNDAQTLTATIGFVHGAPFVGEVDVYVQDETEPRNRDVSYTSLLRSHVETTDGKVSVACRTAGAAVTEPPIASITFDVTSDAAAFDVALRGVATPGVGQRALGFDAFPVTGMPTTEGTHVRFANALVDALSPHLTISGVDNTVDVAPGKTTDIGSQATELDITATTTAGQLPLRPVDISDPKIAATGNIIAFVVGELDGEITAPSNIAIVFAAISEPENDYTAYPIAFAPAQGVGKLLTVIPDVADMVVTVDGTVVDGAPFDAGITDFTFGALSGAVYTRRGERRLLGTEGAVAVIDTNVGSPERTTYLWIAAGYESPGSGQQHKVFIQLDAPGSPAAGSVIVVNAIPDAPSVGLKADGSVLITDFDFAAVASTTLAAGVHTMVAQYDVTGDSVPDDLPVSLTTGEASQVLVLTGTILTSDDKPLQFIVIDRASNGDLSIPL